MKEHFYSWIVDDSAQPNVLDWLAKLHQPDTFRPLKSGLREDLSPRCFLQGPCQPSLPNQSLLHRVITHFLTWVLSQTSSHPLPLSNFTIRLYIYSSLASPRLVSFVHTVPSPRLALFPFVSFRLPSSHIPCRLWKSVPSSRYAWKETMKGEKKTF